MKRQTIFCLFGLLVATVVFWANACHCSAVIIIGSAAGNTGTPLDAGLASRWNQVGDWGSYLGTPIAPNYFLTAKHIGGAVGQSITFPDDNSSYQTVATFQDPNSDLALWQISGAFPSSRIVPMYAGNVVAGVPLTIFGRGLPRTNTVVTGANWPNGTEAKGWLWGTAASARSWGTNTLDGLGDGGAAGTQLAYDFDATGGSNEGILSIGDSGGPVFIYQSGAWGLAGINYAVGPLAVRETIDGPTLTAALYDYGGLYLETGSPVSWQLVSATMANKPAVSYSTFLSPRSDWIEAVITVPEPGTLLLLAAAFLATPLLHRRAQVSRCRRCLPRSFTQFTHSHDPRPSVAESKSMPALHRQ